MIDEGMLREPAEREIRAVALSLLSGARQASELLHAASGELRNGDTAGDDALHDFRVAVRRLRSWLRAFMPWLRDDIPRKMRRRLSEISGATGPTRDAAVHLAWLRSEREAMSARQRAGHSWLCERIETQRREGCEDAIAAATRFTAVAEKLERRLEVHQMAVAPKEQAARFGTILSARLNEESETLRLRLRDIHGFTDVGEAHRARIAAKRLRYLAEQVTHLSDDGEAIIAQLKALQDALGDLHDVHVFADEIVTASADVAALARDPGPGLLHLARLLHERGMHAFADIERDWLNDAGAPFFVHVGALAADLHGRAARDE